MKTSIASRLQVIPSGKALGAEIEGVDIAAGLSDEEFTFMKQAWLEHLVLVVRNQKLDDHQLQDFAALFGALDLAPPNSKGGPWLEDLPYLAVISNVKKGGKPIGSLANGEAIWHTDMSYQENPPTASLLYCLECPPVGGDTWFANMYMANEELPEALRAQVVGRRAIHDSTYNSGGHLRKGFRETSDPREAPGAHHPIVIRHPETDRPALFLGRRRNNYIGGMPLQESEQLLDRLWGHMTQDRFVWRHSWQPGDIVVWDNRCTMHRRDSFDDSHRRIMHRAQVRGVRPLEA